MYSCWNVNPTPPFVDYNYNGWENPSYVDSNITYPSPNGVVLLPPMPKAMALEVRTRK